MKKHQSFIARLFRRNNTPAGCADPAQPAESTLVVVQVDAAGDPISVDVVNDPAPQTEAAIGEEEPTICRDGKRYRARLRNGRWESFGPPIGDC